MTLTGRYRAIDKRNSLKFLRTFLKPIFLLYRRLHTYQDDAYGQGNIFFWLMPFSINGIAWSEKRDENKQTSINRWEIGFIPFFRTIVSA
jgi:hypothetical protein